MIGTTGLGAAHHAMIDDAARDIAVLQAANMSLGVNLLAAMVAQAAARLGDDWDIEVLEMHHRHKIDAPSGTALLLGQAAANARGKSLPELTRFDRNGARESGTIGFASLRGGSVAGDHMVIMAGAGERIELGHPRGKPRHLCARRDQGRIVDRWENRRALHDERRSRALKKADIFEFYRRLAEDNPSPVTELESGNIYQLLVAVVLSAQSTDAGVNKATRGLFATVATPQAMIALGEDALKTHIKTIGLFNTKAKNVIALSHMLVDEYAGAVPTDRDLLQELPGVGRKTANVVLNVALGAETFPVDTHVFRVANRTGLAKGKAPAAVEAILERQTPQPFRSAAHHWLILHGRYVCKARTPECWRCVVVDLCAFRPKSAAPAQKRREIRIGEHDA